MAAGGDPSGGVSSSDPIFSGEETREQPTRRSTLLFQFFIFPLLIVVASVGVFLFFGAIGGSQKSIREYLADVRSGGENVQKQSAQQLATILQAERAKVDAAPESEKAAALAKAEYADATFRRDLETTFSESFDGKTSDRQAFLASAMGLVGDPAYLTALSLHVHPPTPPAIRRAVARAIALLDTSASTPVLISLLKDDDEPVRNQAVEGLSRARARTPDTIVALRGALGDSSEYVRVTAAVALALAKDASGIDLVGKLLDPAFADEMARRAIPGFTTDEPNAEAIVATRNFALASGMKAALVLRDPTLKPKVERLLSHPDSTVKAIAQQVLDRWSSP